MSIISDSIRFQEKPNTAVNVFSKGYKQSGQNLNDHFDNSDGKLAIKIDTDTYEYAAFISFKNITDQSLIEKALEKSSAYKEILNLSLVPEFYKTEKYKSFLRKCGYLEKLSFNVNCEDDYIFIMDMRKHCPSLKRLALIFHESISEFHKLDFSLPQLRYIQLDNYKTVGGNAVFNFSQFPMVDKIDIWYDRDRSLINLKFTGEYPVIPYALHSWFSMVILNEESYPYLEIVYKLTIYRVKNKLKNHPIFEKLSYIDINNTFGSSLRVSADYMPRLETLNIMEPDSMKLPGKIKFGKYFKKLEVWYTNDIKKIFDIFEIPDGLELLGINKILRGTSPAITLKKLPHHTIKRMEIYDYNEVIIKSDPRCPIDIEHTERVDIKCKLRHPIDIYNSPHLLLSCYKRDYDKMINMNIVGQKFVEILISKNRGIYFFSDKDDDDIIKISNETINNFYSNYILDKIIFKNCKINCDILSIDFVKSISFVSCEFLTPLKLTDDIKNIEHILIDGGDFSNLQIDEIPDSLESFDIVLSDDTKYDFKKIPKDYRFKFIAADDNTGILIEDNDDESESDYDTD